MPQNPIGFLFLQLGTPKTLSLCSIFSFLHRFLGDHRVIDLPWWIRWPLVNLFIIPFRIFRVQKAYQSIWKTEGSPLSVISTRLIHALQKKLPKRPIELAYTYEPKSIDQALDSFKKQKVSKIVVLPQFPQYATSASAASIHAFLSRLSLRADYPELIIKRSFYQDPGFIAAVCEIIKKTPKWDHSDLFVFSFHGLPLRHLQKSGCSFASSCQKQACSLFANPHLNDCYKAQCHATTQAIVKKLGIEKPYEVVFQSRLGAAEWIDPSLEGRMPEWVKSSVQSITLVSPSFTVDCLETLEELGDRFREDWCLNGRELRLVDAINDDSFWVNVLSAWIEKMHQNLDSVLVLDSPSVSENI